jgi:HK97 family phage major capsid protein
MNALTKEFTDAVEQQFSKLNKDVQDALSEAKTASIIIRDFEQKMARPRGSDEPAESAGQEFAAHLMELKDIASASANGRRANFSLEMKATITTAAGSGGPLSPQPYRDGLIQAPRRVLRVRGLLPVIGISTGEVQYPKQTTRTNNAAPVAEAALKPESAYGFTMQTTTPKVIAHWVPASKQVLEDAPQLSGIIDTELLYGLALREDAQILAGDGTGENLPGLITNSTAYVAPITITGSTMLDQVALAMLQVSLADFNPTGIVMHPSDWMRIRLLKNADGEYLLGAPGANVEPLLFGLPVVPTTSMPIDKFLVGDFPSAATLYDRWTPRIEVATEHADFFVRNMIAILAEERIALAIKQAGALVYGDFGNVA